MNKPYRDSAAIFVKTESNQKPRGSNKTILNALGTEFDLVTTINTINDLLQRNEIKSISFCKTPKSLASFYLKRFLHKKLINVKE